MNRSFARRLWAGLGLVGLSAALAACSAGTDGQAAWGITVEAREFAFGPASLEVAAGQQVKLTLTNTGALEHNLSLPAIPAGGDVPASGGPDPAVAAEPALYVTAAAKQKTTVEFVAPTEPGTYQFWCTVVGHKEAGMTGTLVVTAP
jgi:plastocyanin